MSESVPLTRATHHAVRPEHTLVWSLAAHTKPSAHAWARSQHGGGEPGCAHSTEGARAKTQLALTVTNLPGMAQVAKAEYADQGVATTAEDNKQGQGEHLFPGQGKMEAHCACAAAAKNI